jgi:hypothetical protein
MSVSPRFLALAAVALLAGSSARATTPAPQEATLPRFTEEREAAALCFLRKNARELLEVLEQLKRDNPPHYQKEIRAVFQVTEMLAELQDDPRRHDLELEIWKAESKAHTLAVRLPALGERERRKAEAELLKVARDLVELDIAVLDLKTEQTEKELGELRYEVAKARDQVPAQTKARYDRLLEEARKRRKS